MNNTISINPNLLIWARESLGLSIDEVVHKLDRKSITTDVFESWENGVTSPTYLQLERLAYDIYKRPIAIFFFLNPH